MYPLKTLLRNGSVDRFPCATNTQNDRKNFGGVVFCTVRIILKEILPVSLCIPLPLLGNDSINMFPRQRRITGDVIIYAVQIM
jgi:hypothetical protein